jgi:hypothetical protein
MRGLKAVLVDCANVAGDVEWPPGATDQSTKTLRALRVLRASFPHSYPPCGLLSGFLFQFDVALV